MTGYHEIRLTGPGREQFRLFCLLENASDEELRSRGLTKPAIAVLDGRRKPWRDRPQRRRLPRGQEARRRPQAPVPAAHRQLTRG